MLLVTGRFDCQELLWRIHEGNRSTAGLKFVTKCYGIIGFMKFLGPYYMFAITRRRKVGTICGHDIYSIGKSEVIAIVVVVLSVVGILQDEVDPMVSVMRIEMAPLESCADIGGLDAQIQEIKEAVELPELYEDIGFRHPNGVILYGEQGKLYLQSSEGGLAGGGTKKL